MEEKKNIDRLYQEKFKDFEAAPRKDLWKDIAGKLKEEEKRKPLVPLFWTRIASVAAILTLILLLGDWFTQSVQNPIVNKADEIPTSQEPEDTRVAVTTDSDDEQEQRSSSEDTGSFAGAGERIMSLMTEISSLSFSGIEEFPNDTDKNIKQQPPKHEETVLGTNKKSLSEEILANQLKEERSVSNTSGGKIEVSTHAAPIYYGNLKSGNFIDPRFDSNNSAGEITYSYGINISYEISEKLKIRSGVSKVSMSHNTNDIAFHAVLNPRSLETVDYNSDLGLRIVQGAITWKGSPEPIASSIRSNIHNITQGLLNQKIGFIEVPVELEYALIKDKISINVIGGASTLFLDENSISISSGDIATVLGKANNLNEISFSTNIGLGFDYKVSDKFKVNLEPMFKYQINTYNTSSGSYQPYYIGIYSGFSYKF